MKQLSKNFSLAEMIKTSSKSLNIPNAEQEHYLQLLCERCLQPIRDLYGKSITVNSGFRSILVNKEKGGVSNSQHLTGQAADITCEDNKALFDLIVKSKIEFDQLIDEKKYTWLHISYKPNANRKQILHLK